LKAWSQSSSKFLLLVWPSGWNRWSVLLGHVDDAEATFADLLQELVRSDVGTETLVR
jgi:hypothetical protein